MSFHPSPLLCSRDAKQSMVFRYMTHFMLCSHRHSWWSCKQIERAKFNPGAKRRNCSDKNLVRTGMQTHTLHKTNYLEVSMSQHNTTGHYNQESEVTQKAADSHEPKGGWVGHQPWTPAKRGRRGSKKPDAKITAVATGPVTAAASVQSTNCPVMLLNLAISKRVNLDKMICVSTGIPLVSSKMFKYLIQDKNRLCNRLQWKVST